MKKTSLGVVMVLLAAMIAVPAADGLTFNATISGNNIHINVDVVVTLDLQTIYNYVRELFENFGAPGSLIPSIDQVLDNLDSTFELVEDVWENYRADFEEAIEDVAETRIRDYVANADVDNLSITFDSKRENYIITVNTNVGFDISGVNVFTNTSDGKRKINLKWRGFKLFGSKLVRGRLIDTGSTFLDLSGFEYPLEQWQKRDENGRMVLTCTLLYQVNLPGYGVGVTIDPTATIVGPPGSAGASISGDEIVMTLPTLPFAGVPPLVVVIVAMVVVVVVLVVVVLKYTSRTYSEAAHKTH
ncbi:MAG: hypothetical protein AB1305_02200 [Candidatus Hadarchaeota archaeon]